MRISNGGLKIDVKTLLIASLNTRRLSRSYCFQQRNLIMLFEKYGTLVRPPDESEVGLARALHFVSVQDIIFDTFLSLC